MYDPVLPDVDEPRRERVQEDFGRHVVEQRNRMAALVRQWIEDDKRFPTQIYDRLLDRVRELDPAFRSDIASVALLMADQIVEAVLGTFDLGDYAHSDDRLVNYAIIAQFRMAGSEEVIDEVDVNRGQPVIAVWKSYKRWLSRYAPVELRPRLLEEEGPTNAGPV
jgi:hypothetical protein